MAFALPGLGWDNLRNEEQGQVIVWNFTNCQTTEDGRYLIPDAVVTVPIKTSRVETYADIFSTSSNVTSSTAKSINLNAGVSDDSVKVSGTFSKEHTRIKSSQVKDKSVATRIQLRYHRYKAILQPGSDLEPSFKASLMSIAMDLDKNLTQSAIYNSQLLIRNFGTHVLNSVVAGAGLSKTDFVSQTYMSSHSGNQKAIAASATLSFASTFNFGSSFKQSSGVTTDSGYKKSLTDSYIESYGGPEVRPFNMSATAWVKSIDSEMVPMDRFGDPLSLLITEQTLPELPTPLRDLLETYVSNAIEEYYEMNVIRGCTRRDSPNYSVAANVDDGSCKAVKTKAALGGLYQTCKVVGDYLHTNPCEGLAEVNPLTGSHSCPDGYEAVDLFNGTKMGKAESSKKCRKCGVLFLSTCCHREYFQAQAHYRTQWCAATANNATDPGYLYGGIYSARSTNLITGKRECPPNYFKQRIFQEHTICLKGRSRKTESDEIPFGGFIGCKVGNPLAYKPKLRSNRRTWSDSCPDGFSRHLVGNVEGCAIRHCVTSGSLKTPAIVPIRRPPFISRPATVKESDVFVILNSTGQEKTGGKFVTQGAYKQAMGHRTSSTNGLDDHHAEHHASHISHTHDASKSSAPSRDVGISEWLTFVTILETATQSTTSTLPSPKTTRTTPSGFHQDEV